MADKPYLFTIPSGKLTGASVPTLQLASGLRERGERVILLCQGGKLAQEARARRLEVASLSPFTLAKWGRKARVVVVSRSWDHFWALLLLGTQRPMVRLWYNATYPVRSLTRGLLTLFVKRVMVPYRGDWGPKARWLPGGVDVGSFRPGEKDIGGMGVVMVARMKPGRGHETLVRVIRGLEAPFTVTFRGGGETLEYVRSLVRSLELEDRCRFLPKKVEDYPAFLRRHHVLVYLSPGSEATARTVLEAMASGLVVLAPGLGPIPSYLGEWNPSLGGDLVAALEGYAWSPAARKRVGYLNARRAMRFSLEKRAERFLKALEDET